jgi:hypothetical protein
VPPPERTLSTPLLTPAGRRWRGRRRDARAARQVEREAQRATARAAGDIISAGERQASRGAGGLPRAGEPGQSALRCWRRFVVPPHAATSAVLAGAYPFLAEGGLGSEGMFVGTDLFSGGAFVFDPWVFYRKGILTNPNVLLAGVIGTGKSALAKSLATRSVAFGARVYVPGDPKGEWTPVARALGGSSIALGHGLPARLNPLDEGQRPPATSDREWTALVWARRRELLGVLTETVLGRALRPVEHTVLDLALRAATQHRGVPTLPGVVYHLMEPEDELLDATDVQPADARDVAHAMRRLVHGDLEGLFDGESTIRFDPGDPMVTLDLSHIGGNDTLLSLVMTCASAWMESALLDPDAGRRWVVYDEAWRIMRQPALIRRMQSQWKLSRAYGIANLMVVHRLSDLDAVGDANSEARALAQGLLADCSTRIIYRQETDQLATSESALGLSETERDLLPVFGIGQGLWRIRDRAFVVQHQMTRGELELFDTSGRMASLMSGRSSS